MIFETILCGVDGSPAGFEALRQAKTLRSPEGRLLVVVAYSPAQAAHAGFGASRAAEQIEAEAERTIESVRQELAGVDAAEAQLVEGRAVSALLELAGREGATLLAVGSHGKRRAAGIALGGVATTMLHDAPCPVLIARVPGVPEVFPSSLVLGLDGSPESEAAAAVATELRERFGADLRAVVAGGGKGVDEDAVRRIVGDVEVDARPPVEALVAASEDADLLLVGSRGLHGVRALGSVSERVAHRADCSVLVVRAAGR